MWYKQQDKRLNDASQKKDEPFGGVNLSGAYAGPKVCGS
jgi:hypothetical protein